MSFAWEVTEEDVAMVLASHGIFDNSVVSEAHGDLDHDEIENTVLCYDEMEDQTAAALESIELQLLELEYITGTSMFKK